MPFEIHLPEPYKSGQFVPPVQKVKDLLIKAFKQKKSETVDETYISELYLGVNEPSVSRRTKTAFLSSFIPGDTDEDHVQLRDEIEEYVAEKRCPRDSNPLDYYRKLERNKYPILRELAKGFLGFRIILH
ncbi:unnamed protein product [Allacma fusca]|uniref:Uncharacterized protein n=1 Tax=Allacma fusca TaxID=39272 RepID=A0A8J2NZR1_9HEXA|nr:unnamed protein product [Allacma fusca]